MKTQTTISPRIAGCRRAVPVLLATALALGGCAATHVGDTWQCPLAQGTACTSVAEADPVVTPLGKVEPANRGLPRGEVGETGKSGAECVRNCDPLAWLAGLFASGEVQQDAAAAPEPEALPGEQAASDVAQESLRTKERIARIWIAPFVDAGGVYREGQWVRAVLEPARWRLR